jgi:DNA-binding YbaB/EbfC family protein
VFDKLGNFADLVRNAGKIQETVMKAGESLGKVEVEADAGGGAVKVRVNGRLEVLAVRIDPKLLADGDAELLEDLVTAAVNQALVKAREAAAQSLTSLAGGMTLPGFGSPGGGG